MSAKWRAISSILGRKVGTIGATMRGNGVAAEFQPNLGMLKVIWVFLFFYMTQLQLFIAMICKFVQSSHIFEQFKLSPNCNFVCGYEGAPIPTF